MKITTDHEIQLVTIQIPFREAEELDEAFKESCSVFLEKYIGEMTKAEYKVTQFFSQINQLIQ